MSTKVNPIRRNLQFRLPRHRVTVWNGAGKHVTQFYNTLSIFFPVGERFFIQSLRHYRHVADSPELKEEVAAFIGQEAFHGREHDEYNDCRQDFQKPGRIIVRLNCRPDQYTQVYTQPYYNTRHELIRLL